MGLPFKLKSYFKAGFIYRKSKNRKEGLLQLQNSHTHSKYQNSQIKSKHTKIAGGKVKSDTSGGNHTGTL